MNKNLDKVILVDNQDNIIGEMDKVEAHKGNGKLHRAISVYLFKKNENGTQLLIQQRSEQKIVGQGLWANTVCGNVRPIENYQQCAIRRLREEVGITKVDINPLIKFQYQVKCNEKFSENEIDQIFVGFYNGKVDPNLAEVQDYKWINWHELLDSLEQAKTIDFGGLKIRNGLELAPWFVIMLKRNDITTSINEFIK